MSGLLRNLWERGLPAALVLLVAVAVKATFWPADRLGRCLVILVGVLLVSVSLSDEVRAKLTVPTVLLVLALAGLASHTLVGVGAGVAAALLAGVSVLVVVGKVKTKVGVLLDELADWPAVVVLTVLLAGVLVANPTAAVLAVALSILLAVRGVPDECAIGVLALLLLFVLPVGLTVAFVTATVIAAVLMAQKIRFLWTDCACDECRAAETTVTIV